MCSTDSDVGRRVAPGITRTFGESVRKRRCFTNRGIDQAGNRRISQFLVERANESSAGSRQQYHSGF